MTGANDSVNFFKNILEKMSYEEIEKYLKEKVFSFRDSEGNKSLIPIDYIEHIKNKYHTLNNEGQVILLVKMLNLLDYKENIDDVNSLNHNKKIVKALIPEINFYLIFKYLEYSKCIEFLINVEHIIDELINFDLTKYDEIQNFKEESRQNKSYIKKL